jgi:formyltetrahydrofolate-dependent phosphoribosylglycinamide formyltransferase
MLIQISCSFKSTFAAINELLMFERLQKKWGVSGWRLLIILITFAVGGSLTGYVGKKIMNGLDIGNPILWTIVYVIVVTIVWPFMVLGVSVVTGQFFFFKTYIGKLGRRMIRRKDYGQQTTDDREITDQTSHIVHRTSNIQRRIAIFASGAGSNAQKIIDHFKQSSTIKIALIVSNKPNAGVIEIAEKENIPVVLIEKENFFRGDAYVSQLQQANIDFIVLAGFLWKVPQQLINAYRGKIVNIHPALLPNYGGKGMYGSFVHQAVLHAKEKESGITIHYVDEHYDHGDVIFQARCEVKEDDTPETLAQRIHELEHQYYPQVIERLLHQVKKPAIPH